MSNQERLVEILFTIDIPKFRKEVNIGNLTWIIRNLGFKNKNNPNFCRSK